LDISRLPTKHNHFQAIFVVEMSMQSGNDDRVTLMLKISELLRQQTSVMKVDKGDRANDKRISGDNDRADESVAN